MEAAEPQVFASIAPDVPPPGLTLIARAPARMLESNFDVRALPLADSLLIFIRQLN
ncbi:hypothetical protein OKW35_002387 [Paraburkholderia sp. MM5477-R1]